MKEEISEFTGHVISSFDQGHSKSVNLEVCVSTPSKGKNRKYCSILKRATGILPLVISP